MSDLVRNPQNRVSFYEAQIPSLFGLLKVYMYVDINYFQDEEISSDSPDDVGCGFQYLSSDVVKDCPMSIEYTLEEDTESLTSTTSSIPFSQDDDSISRIINDQLGGKNGFKNVSLTFIMFDNK